MIENFTEIIALADEITKNDPEGQIKVASLTKGLANALKNTQGKVDGMRSTHFIDKKLEAEGAFAAWLDANPAAKAKYGDIQPGTKALYDKLEKTRERDNVLGLIQGLAGLQINVAGQAYIVAKELEKPEKERQPGFTRETADEILDQLQYAYADYYEPFDKALFSRTLKMAASLPAGQRLDGIEDILTNGSKNIDQFVEEAYRHSKLNELEYAKGLFSMTSKQLEAMDNPFIRMAIALYPVNESSRLENEQFAASVTGFRKRYLEALYEWKGSGLYPDANSTMRFTWGPVKGYEPADAVTYHPFTSLKGVMAKNTGKEPFDVPQALIDLYNNKDFGRWADPVLKDVPVAFTHQCDITGGNSGSPVMNAKGEVIGVAFDGNYEAMIGDWQYDYDLQRTISVDIRYVMFITDKFAKAGFILDEMGVKH